MSIDFETRLKHAGLVMAVFNAWRRRRRTSRRRRRSLTAEGSSALTRVSKLSPPFKKVTNPLSVPSNLYHLQANLSNVAALPSQALQESSPPPQSRDLLETLNRRSSTTANFCIPPASAHVPRTSCIFKGPPQARRHWTIGRRRCHLTIPGMARLSKPMAASALLPAITRSPYLSL